MFGAAPAPATQAMAPIAFDWLRCNAREVSQSLSLAAGSQSSTVDGHGAQVSQTYEDKVNALNFVWLFV